MSYPRLKAKASSIIAPPCVLLANPKEGIGRSFPGYPGGSHLFFKKREALRSRSKVNPQWGQWNTRFSKRFWLILPQRFTQAVVSGYSEHGFSSFKNTPGTLLTRRKRSRTAEASSFWLRFFGSNFGRSSPLTPKRRTPV